MAKPTAPVTRPSVTTETTVRSASEKRETERHRATRIPVYTSAVSKKPGVVADGLAIVRYHIVLIAMAATLVFGWLMTGQRPFALALIAGLDWFLINLLNRVTDLGRRSRQRHPRHRARRTQQTSRRVRQLRAALLLLRDAPRLSADHAAACDRPADRDGLQLPARPDVLRGMRRLKELYFFKNFGSACPSC